MIKIALATVVAVFVGVSLGAFFNLVPTANGQFVNSTARLATVTERPFNGTACAPTTTPFFNLVPAIQYDCGGSGIAYRVTPRTDPTCSVSGSSYRPDFVNFKTSPWTAQPSVPYIICGSTTLPTGGDLHKYSINVSQTGPYTITLYTVNTTAGAVWNIIIDGVVVATMTLSNGPDFNTVVSNTSQSFNMSLGNHVLSLVGVTGDPSGNYIGDLAGWQGAAIGALVFNPTSLNFSSAPGVASSPQTVTATNTGVLTLNLSAPTITGANPADFTISSNTCGSTLAAGANCRIGVTFQRSTSGTSSASLSINGT